MNPGRSAARRSATYSLTLCLLAAAGCPPPVPNQAPTADAGADPSASGGVIVTLGGSTSSDADGDALSFSWIQTAGMAVALMDADTESASFTAPNLDATLRFNTSCEAVAGGPSAAAVDSFTGRTTWSSLKKPFTRWQNEGTGGRGARRSGSGTSGSAQKQTVRPFDGATPTVFASWNRRRLAQR